jgi:hypothetical protein
MQESSGVIGTRARRFVVVLLVLSGLGAMALYALPPLLRWAVNALVDWYDGLAAGGPLGFGLPMLAALVAVVLIVGRRSGQD